MADHGVPWLVPGSGTGHVSQFFGIIADQLDFRVFQPIAFLTGDAHVAVIVDVEAVMRQSGEVITDREVHLWTSDDTGKVSALRHFLDTHQHVTATRRAATTTADT